MSEIIQPEEPDPPSENLDTSRYVEANDISWERDYAADALTEKYEFAVLLSYADTLFEKHSKAVGDKYSKEICVEGAYFRRCLIERTESYGYYFTEGDRENGRKRTWNSKGASVDYCPNEAYQEPATAVRLRLEVAFKEEDAIDLPKRFGSMVIDKVLGKLPRFLHAS